MNLLIHFVNYFQVYFISRVIYSWICVRYSISVIRMCLTIAGIGVGLTRDTATLMVGQYFKRRREAVEIALVGSSGIGLAVMTAFLHTTLR